jgi:hypothetical protein
VFLDFQLCTESQRAYLKVSPGEDILLVDRGNTILTQTVAQDREIFQHAVLLFLYLPTG